MKISVISKNDTMVTLARKIGYRPFGVDESNEYSLVKLLVSGKNYPRFHIYGRKIADGEFELNLHLDQKMASYEGSSAHSGEYDGELIEKEAERIKRNF